jgi:hypothetical protein
MDNASITSPVPRRRLAGAVGVWQALRQGEGHLQKSLHATHISTPFSVIAMCAASCNAVVATGGADVCAGVRKLTARNRVLPAARASAARAA